MSDSRPWLKQYPNEIPAHLTYDGIPIHEYLQRAAANYPSKIATYFMGKNLTYQKLYQSALGLAGYLQRIGINKGDRVAVMLPNTPQAVIGFFGILLAGAVVVQTNPLYTERELEYQMKDSGAKAIICLDILFPRVAKVRLRTEIQDIIVTAIKDFLPFPKNFIYPFIQKKQYGLVVHVKHGGNHHLLTEILKTPISLINVPDIQIAEDLAVLQYTGGTTGFPKGVMLTHQNLAANTMMCKAWLYKAKPGEETLLGIVPFFHVYGMTTVMLLAMIDAHKIVLLPKFDPLTALKTIQSQKPTLFPGAPTIYIGLLNHPDLKKYDLSSIKACISGSAPLPVEIQQQFEDITGGKLVEGYGLSETSPVTHANFLWGNRVKGSIGVPFPDTDAQIHSLETGEPVPIGEIGEIAIKGPQVMKGYWNRPEETAETFRDGWLLTGDLGYMDENGYFYVVDRKKDLIIAGGFNIYPREIEEVLYQHEAVAEVVACGVPDPYRGETVKVYIVLKENANVTEKELDHFSRIHLAAYKVPRLYEFRQELPKTAIGKILRRALVTEERLRTLQNPDDEKHA